MSSHNDLSPVPASNYTAVVLLLEEYQRDAREAAEQRDAALALLREVEFVNMNTDPIGTLLMCPICEGLPGRLGHAADCRLSALIKP